MGKGLSDHSGHSAENWVALTAADALASSPIRSSFFYDFLRKTNVPNKKKMKTTLEKVLLSSSFKFDNENENNSWKSAAKFLL